MIQKKKYNYLNDLNEIKQCFQQWIENINKLKDSNEEQIIRAITKSINRMKKFMMFNSIVNLQQDQKELKQQNEDYCAQLPDFEILQEQYWEFSYYQKNQQTIKQYKELKEQHKNKIKEMKKLIFTQPQPMSKIIKQIPAIFQGYLDVEKQTISGRLFFSIENKFMDCFLIKNIIQFQIENGMLYKPLPDLFLKNFIISLQEANCSIFDSDQFNEFLNKNKKIYGIQLNSYKNSKEQFKQKIQTIEAQIFCSKLPKLYHSILGFFYGMINNIKRVISGRILILSKQILCDIIVIDDQIEFQISMLGDEILLEKDENIMFPSILEKLKNSLQPINGF